MNLSSRSRRTAVVIGVVVAAVVIVLLFVVNISPAYHGVYFSTAMINGTTATAGSTSCGTGPWHIAAGSDSRVELAWVVSTLFANLSSPGESYANISIGGGSGTPYVASGIDGSATIQVSSSAGLTVVYGLCTDALAATLTLYGNVTTFSPIL